MKELVCSPRLDRLLLLHPADDRSCGESQKPHKRARTSTLLPTYRCTLLGYMEKASSQIMCDFYPLQEAASVFCVNFFLPLPPHLRLSSAFPYMGYFIHMLYTYSMYIYIFFLSPLSNLSVKEKMRKVRDTPRKRKLQENKEFP